MRSKLMSAPYLVWMAIFIVAPLIFVFYYAFTDKSGAFTFNNIVALKAYLPTFLDSILLGAIAALICLLIAYPFAYFISRTTPKTQRIMILLVMLPMCMSFLLRTLAWVSLLEDTGIINNLLTAIGLRPLKLIQTRTSIVFGMVYNYLPYMILPLYTVLLKLDPKLLEASAVTAVAPLPE